MDRREDLLRAEAEGWEELVALLARATPERLEEPGLNPEGWSPKDALWHLAYWCAEAERVLTEIRDGTFDPTGEPEGSEEVDAVNAAQLERSRAMALDDVLAALPRARADMLERVGQLVELTDDAEEWIEESGPIHYAEHLPALRAWLGDA